MDMVIFYFLRFRSKKYDSVTFADKINYYLCCYLCW